MLIRSIPSLFERRVTDSQTGPLLAEPVIRRLMETFRSPLRPGKETEMPKKLLMLQALSARDRDLTEDELTDIIAFYNENPVRREVFEFVFPGNGFPRSLLTPSLCPSRLLLASTCTSSSSSLSTPRCYLPNCPRPSSAHTTGCASVLGWTLTNGRGSLNGCTLATAIFLAGTHHRAAVMASLEACPTNVHLRLTLPDVACSRAEALTWTTSLILSVLEGTPATSPSLALRVTTDTRWLAMQMQLGHSSSAACRRSA